MIKNNFVLVGILLLISQLVSAQVEEVKDDPSVPSVKIKPVFPQTGSSIIFIEGEDAVATNFNREPILNYSCSGYRTLQLNQATGLQGDSVYYADYVFYVEEDGVYEFWYGGTPPGNRDELLTSFSSPFRFILDSFYEYDIYREDVNVAGGYAPAYYWNSVSELTLSKGEHRIRFEVPIRRSFDSKYFFYLDNFFLIKKENGVRILTGNIPKIFPSDMDDRSMDSPFKSIEDYEILIRDNPEQSRNYIEISMIYSLIGDYLSSLKNLRKALLLEPDDSDIILLIAKNLIWKGAYQDGLYYFSDLLKLVPERVDYWAEAGKVAAWTGQYETSKEFFDDGIEMFPDNLNLQANLGITYLWEGDPAADKQFKLVGELAGDDLNLNIELAEIFEVNGYPDKAIEIYKKITDLYPENLEIRFFLEDAYIQNSQRDKIKDLRKSTSELYEASADFEKVLQTFYNKQTMKEKVITDYEEELVNDPDNLSLRKTLAEIYFWNGDKKRAIAEYLNILTNYAYRNIRETEKNVVQFYEFIDRNYALLHFLDEVPGYLSSSMKELSTDLANYKKAVSRLGLLEKKNEAAIAKNQEPDLEAVTRLEEEIDSTENKLASRIAAKESFIEKYQFILDQFESDTGYLTRLISEEESANETFRKLAEGSQWEWDRGRMVSELEGVSKNGLNLAGYVLAAINQIEGNLMEASDNLDSLITNKAILMDVPFSLFQNSLWLGDNEKRADIYKDFPDEIISYGDYVYDLIDYLDYLNLEDDEIFGFLNDDPSIPISAISENFTEIKADIKNLHKKVQLNIQNVHEILKEKMVQGFYHLAEETYLIRNELGDFYQNDNMFPEAIDQYRQVLAIDPWNLSARYKLGLVYHWNGNWKKALDLYEEVYNEDPVFGNVTSFYNQLARDHADRLGFESIVYGDTSKMSFELNSFYDANINGIFSLGIDYNVINNRIYRDFSPETASSYLLHDLSLEFPIDLLLVVISPKGGLFARSDLVDTTFTGTPSMLDFLAEYNIYPHGGISASVWSGPLGVYGGYQYSWEKDSFQPGRSAVSYQKGDISLQLDLGFTKVPVIKKSSALISGFGRQVEDGNIIYGGSFEFFNEVKLSTNPDVSLNLSTSVVYEDSIDGSTDNYWAPTDSLTVGGGIEASGEFNLNDNITIVDRLGFTANYFSENGDSGVDFIFGNTFEYMKGAFNGYIRLEGTVRDTGDYWSMSFILGASAGLPELLSL